MTASVSVIVPFFDEIEYINEAVTSVFAQGLRDVEVIIVVDNPDYVHSNLLHENVNGDQCKIVSNRCNLGLSAARNTGLAHASGDWVAFLDADDYYLHQGLASQLDFARSSGADITHAQTLRSSFGTPDAAVLRWDRQLHAQRRRGGSLKEFPEAQFIASSWSSLYRRDFIERFGLRFDPEQRRFEDRLFVMQAVTQARGIAFLGKPNRIWRGRRGSISVSATNTDTRRLQIMLLEKCLAVAEDATAANRVPVSVLHRESVNTLWRLIWDLDLLDVLAEGQTEEAIHLNERMSALVKRLVLPRQVEKDPIMRKISRVGHRTRRGKIEARVYRRIVSDLVSCRFDTAFAAIESAKRRPPPKQTQFGSRKRLILHIGLHKTGSTYIQHCLLAHRSKLSDQGVLVPMTGFDTPAGSHVRADAHSGHRGLFRAIRNHKLEIFRDFQAEVYASRCDTVLISCENMLFPYLNGREDALRDLFAQFGGFRQVEVVAFARRPDVWLDAYYREWVLNGARGGARGFGSFAREYAPLLLNWPELFGPFEALSGQRIRLMGYDALVQDHALWRGFAELCGLPRAASSLEAPDKKKIYRTPNRTDVAVGELIAALEPRTDRRVQLLKGYFARGEVTPDESALCDTKTRREQIETFEQYSRAFARERGYAPDTGAWKQALEEEPWTPAGAIDALSLQRLTRAGLCLPVESAQLAANSRSWYGRRKLRVKLRPWAARLVERSRMSFGSGGSY